jgi:hypothetical protein
LEVMVGCPSGVSRATSAGSIGCPFAARWSKAAWMYTVCQSTITLIMMPRLCRDVLIRKRSLIQAKIAPSASAQFRPGISEACPAASYRPGQRATGFAGPAGTCRRPVPAGRTGRSRRPAPLGALLPVRWLAGLGSPGRAADLSPVIMRGRRQYRLDWHHQVANAVEYGLIMFRTRRSIRFTPHLQ